METMCLMYLIPFHLFCSSHYHQSVLPVAHIFFSLSSLTRNRTAPHKRGMHWSTLSAVEAAEGRTAHNNGWNRANGKASNTWKICVWCICYHSSYYARAIATNPSSPIKVPPTSCDWVYKTLRALSFTDWPGESRWTLWSLIDVTC